MFLQTQWINIRICLNVLISLVCAENCFAIWYVNIDQVFTLIPKSMLILLNDRRLVKYKRFQKKKTTSVKYW